MLTTAASVYVIWIAGAIALAVISLALGAIGDIFKGR